MSPRIFLDEAISFSFSSSDRGAQIRKILQRNDTERRLKYDIQCRVRLILHLYPLLPSIPSLASLPPSLHPSPFNGMIDIARVIVCVSAALCARAPKGLFCINEARSAN